MWYLPNLQVSQEIYEETMPMILVEEIDRFMATSNAEFVN
jgi:hypothetical protein